MLGQGARFLQVSPVGADGEDGGQAAVGPEPERDADRHAVRWCHLLRPAATCCCFLCYLLLVVVVLLLFLVLPAAGAGGGGAAVIYYGVRWDGMHM